MPAEGKESALLSSVAHGHGSWSCGCSTPMDIQAAPIMLSEILKKEVKDTKRQEDGKEDGSGGDEGKVREDLI